MVSYWLNVRLIEQIRALVIVTIAKPLSRAVMAKNPSQKELLKFYKCFPTAAAELEHLQS